MSGVLMNPPTSLLDAYGASVTFWRRMRDIGNEMVAAGASKDVTPLRAYQHQKYRAGKRGIAWQLTLPEWWAIWEQSGHWSERGIGRGYMMCRNGDVGPYAPGNVFVGPGAQNLSDACKKADLPIGVARVRKGVLKPYRAYCNVGGKQRHLGVYSTVDEARAAYLKALEIDLALKAVAA